MKAARTPAREIPGRRFLFRKGRGAGMTRPKNRPPAGKGMAQSEQKTNRSRRGSRTVGHLYPELIPAVNRNLYRPQINTTQKSPDGCTRVPSIRRFSDDDADHPHHPTDRPPDLPGEKPPKKGFFLMRLPLMSPLRREELHRR